MDEQITSDKTSEKRRSSNTLASILLLVVVIIVILLLWRSCGKTTGSEDAGAADNVIERVEDLPQDQQAVSMWVRPEISIHDVLARNGLGDLEPIDMGEDTYVIGVEGDAAALVEQLDSDPGLYDAGFLYLED